MAFTRLDRPLRQACSGCGGSCQGVVVTLLDEEERERIARLGAELGVVDPVGPRGLRQQGGRCVFLDEAQRCRLHGTYGAQSKPALCRQYPLVATKVGDETRVGIDPGCFSHGSTWRSAPELPVDGVLALAVPLSPQEATYEEALLDLLGHEGMTIERFAGVIAQEPCAGWPPGFTARLLEAADDPTLRSRLDAPDTSPRVRESVRALLAVAGPGAVPALVPQAYALDALQRLLFLRLCHRIPSVVGVAALGVMGLALAARLEADEARLGELFAGWTRAMRATPFWGTLLPDGERLMRLIRG